MGGKGAGGQIGGTEGRFTVNSFQTNSSSSGADVELFFYPPSFPPMWHDSWLNTKLKRNKGLARVCTSVQTAEPTKTRTHV